MRLTSLGELVLGAPLGRAIYNQRGEVLLAAGVTLTAEYVRLLRLRGFSSVFVEDEESAGIVVEDLLSDESRARATALTGSSLDATSRVASQLADALGGLEQDEPVVEALRSGENRREIERIVPGVELVTFARDLGGELLGGPPRVGLTSLKGVDGFLAGHLVDVAAVAIQLGRRAGLRPEDLRRLARGALVHDVGQVFGGENVDGKASALTGADVESLRRHTIVGYEFLRNVAAFDPLSNHVAYQHHERQDGQGYPRGLAGTNQILRESSGATGRILLLAEITAVADVYDALTSDRSDRPALPREFAFSLIAKMAGAGLNRDLVDQFLRIVPVFPAGYPVRVVAGRLAGCQGLVARADVGSGDPPILRLLVDPRGQRVQPVDVDLARYPGTRLASIGSGNAAH